MTYINDLVLGSGTAPCVVSVHARVNDAETSQFSDTATRTKKNLWDTHYYRVLNFFKKKYKNYDYLETKQFKILVQLLKNTWKNNDNFFLGGGGNELGTRP